MTADITAATHAYENLRNTFLPDSWLRLPNGREMLFAGIALHSETLDPLIIMVDIETAKWHAAAPGAVRVTQPHGSVPDIIAFCTLSPHRHKKGGVYTRLAEIERRDGDMTLYVSHSDGMWWVRPQAMFHDGRFAPASDAIPLSRQALEI